jgi:hypothetical protein
VFQSFLPGTIDPMHCNPSAILARHAPDGEIQLARMLVLETTTTKGMKCALSRQAIIKRALDQRTLALERGAKPLKNSLL